MTEQQVKAAYLYNFANLATWPAGAFEGLAGPFRVCTAADSALDSELMLTLRNERVAGHPVVVLRRPTGPDLRRCHMLFVPSGTPMVDALLRNVADAAVLTVGEERGFLRRGGVLEFGVDEGRVRFDVNTDAATARGITLSSRLLQVAREVQ